MSFKSYLADDLQTFVNTDEFADVCTFNFGGEDLQISAVVDSNVVNDFEGAQLRGVFTATVVVYVKQGDLPQLPPVGSVFTLDGLQYFCRDVRVEQGMDILTLERKQS